MQFLSINMILQRSKITAMAIFCYGALLLIRTDSIGQDVWQRTNGPYGGNIQALLTNASGDIFAATANGGFFRSLDNGNAWVESNNGIKSLRGSSLAVAPNGYIFAGTWGGGVFRSKDNGEFWKQVNNGLKNRVVQSIVVDSNGTVFAGTYITGEVFRSSDNGDNWVDVSTGFGFDLHTLKISQNGYLLEKLQWHKMGISTFQQTAFIGFKAVEFVGKNLVQA